MSARAVSIFAVQGDRGCHWGDSAPGLVEPGGPGEWRRTAGSRASLRPVCLLVAGSRFAPGRPSPECGPCGLRGEGCVPGCGAGCVAQAEGLPGGVWPLGPTQAWTADLGRPVRLYWCPPSGPAPHRPAFPRRSGSSCRKSLVLPRHVEGWGRDMWVICLKD